MNTKILIIIAVVILLVIVMRKKEGYEDNYTHKDFSYMDGINWNTSRDAGVDLDTNSNSFAYHMTKADAVAKCNASCNCKGFSMWGDLPDTSTTAISFFSNDFYKTGNLIQSSANDTSSNKWAKSYETFIKKSKYDIDTGYMNGVNNATAKEAGINLGTGQFANHLTEYEAISKCEAQPDCKGFSRWANEPCKTPTFYFSHNHTGSRDNSSNYQTFTKKPDPNPKPWDPPVTGHIHDSENISEDLPGDYHTERAAKHYCNINPKCAGFSRYDSTGKSYTYFFNKDTAKNATPDTTYSNYKTYKKPTIKYKKINGYVDVFQGEKGRDVPGYQTSMTLEEAKDACNAKDYCAGFFRTQNGSNPLLTFFIGKDNAAAINGTVHGTFRSYSTYYKEE